MSKYIDMITTENKTLTEKYDKVSKENEKLKEQVAGLKRLVYDFKCENEILKENQCKNNHMCEKFSNEVKGIMQFANIFK